jgi:tryptophan synthase alpha chain
LSDISKVFRSRGDSGVLIAYMMGGDPNIDASYKLAKAAISGGADIIELGIPFSDPIADGRSIQAASVRALQSKTTPDDVIRVGTKLKRDFHIPIVLMTYYNLVYSKGIRNFFDAMNKGQIDGIIIPDLPVEEVHLLREQAGTKSVDVILLAAPTTPSQRLVKIAGLTNGFLYLVSVVGVTGARSEIKDASLEFVSKAKRLTNGRVPLVVGFGVSKPSHVSRFINAGADGVVVGSAIVDFVSSLKESPNLFEEVEKFVGSLKEAARLS